jgi:phospholipase/carboxylesterase
VTPIERGGFEAGRLTVHRIRGRECQPKVAVLLCHGYGAPGSDLVPIAGELIGISSSVAKHVAFYFPEAPISLGGYPPFQMRAWWALDVAALEEAMARGRPLDRRQECPEDLPRLRTQIEAVLDQIRDETGLVRSSIVLGGFSQGAMLATDVALHLEEPPGALVAFSGTLLCSEEWTRLARSRKPFPVLQSHGRTDSLLPFAAAEHLFKLWQDPTNAHFVSFDGPHTIPSEALEAFLDLLENLIASRE